MRYENNGIEIQYRECQILRDAAKPLFQGDGDFGCSNLVNKKELWMGNIRADKNENAMRAKYGRPLVQMLKDMEPEDFAAVAEYTESLVKKGTGIDLMVPYIAANRVLILPVNVHTPVGDRDSMPGIDDEKETMWTDQS